MSGRDWDAELKKIDRQLESVADSAIFPSSPSAPPQAKAAVMAQRQATSSLGVFARLGLSAARGVGMVFWPYASRCGTGLAGWLAAVAVLVASGLWSAVWTWRHRAARAHVLALLLALWGAVLAAQEILPRVGYAKPTPEHPARWGCQV